MVLRDFFLKYRPQRSSDDQVAMGLYYKDLPGLCFIHEVFCNPYLQFGMKVCLRILNGNNFAGQCQSTLQDYWRKLMKPRAEVVHGGLTILQG